MTTGSKPPRRPVAPPPGGLLGPGAPAPRATTLLPEVRSDSGLVLDEPTHLQANPYTGTPFLAKILWRVDLGWREADEVQQWLLGKPAHGNGATREEAFKAFIEKAMVAGDPPRPFLQYLGIYLSEEISHARYTVLLAMTRQVKWEDYQQSWWDAVNGLGPPTDPWRTELTWFLRATVGLATADVELLLHAAAVGDLRTLGRAGPRYPLVRVLID